jgi:magnesium chelatase family protein
MTSGELRRHCERDPACSRVMERAIEQLSISARGYTRILKVARTITDLDGSARIGAAHLSEAVRYRMTQSHA